MNTSKLLFGRRAPSHSLGTEVTAGRQGLLGVPARQTGISPRRRSAAVVPSVPSLPWSWHGAGGGAAVSSGCLHAPVPHGVYNTTWAWTVSKTTVLLSLCPPPGTEIISLKIVKCGALRRALFADGVDLCDKNLALFLTAW